MDDLAQMQTWRAPQDFIAQAQTRPEAPALSVADQTLSYGALWARAQNLAAAIASTETATSQPVVAIYGSRRVDTYAAILAALMRGQAYVPLNPKFPNARNRYILERSGASALLFDPQDAEAVAQILATPAAGDPRLIDMGQVQNATPPPLRHDSPYAYILFTSGSTGQPKGVRLRHSNLSAYLDATFAVTDYGPEDRLSQNFDLTFDLSVHDMFVSWRAGAHLVVPSETDLDRPAAYIRAQGITCWFSVPSLAQKIRMQQDLTPANLEGLRLSLFCGEALPLDLAREWAHATASRVENWYGPTEATIAATRYVLPADTDRISGRNNLVAIGTALPGMATAIDPKTGELLLLGPQVAEGYLGDADKTAQAFVPHQGQRAYRTGDRAETDADGILHFVDRLDNQIKIRGYRVELGEIEAAIREASGGCAAVVTPLPLKSPTPTSLVGVVEGYRGPGKEVRTALEGNLPEYMTPTRVLVMPNFPKNAAGKVDRLAIGERVMKRLQKINEKAQPKKMKRYDHLIAFAQQINPAIARDRLENAPNLMDAGLDSMGFVEFSLRLETHFELELTQETVAALSQMSLWQMVAWLRRALESDNPDRFAPPKGLSGGDLKRSLHYRAMRALDFLDHYPAWAQTGAPIVPFVGSSGFMRAIDPSVIEATAKAHGAQIRAANVGMAMLTVTGIAEFCEFLRDTARAQGQRFPLSVLEMEIMQLSIMPPAGDIEILEDYKQGLFQGVARKNYDADTIWDPKTGGMISPQGLNSPVREANWEKKRNQEIRAAFEGQTPMDPPSVAAWVRGLEALCEVSDRVAVVIHPIQGLSPKRPGNDPLSQMLAQTLQGRDVQFIDTDAFDLDDGDFKNISHVNEAQGRGKFSAQLGDLLFGDLR